MGQLVYDYGPHNVNPDIFSEEKEKNEKLYFLAYPTDKENDFTTSIEKFKERLTVKYRNTLWLGRISRSQFFYSCGKTSKKLKIFMKIHAYSKKSTFSALLDLFIHMNMPKIRYPRLEKNFE